MCDHLLGTVGPSMGLDSTALAKLRHVFSTHALYRKLCQPLDGDLTNLDTSYQAGWERSMYKFMSFTEEIAFGDSFDSFLKTGCRAGKAPADVMEYEPLEKQLQDIKDLLKSEREKVSASRLAVATDAGEEGGSKGGDAIAAEPTCEPAPEKNRECSRLVHSLIKLHVEPDAQGELKRMLLSSPVGQMLGTPNASYIAITVDIKYIGMTDSKPHRRIPPWQHQPLLLCRHAWNNPHNHPEFEHPIAPALPPFGVGLSV